MKKVIWYFVGIAVLVAVGFFMFGGNLRSTGNVIQNEDLVSISLSEKASFYEYDGIKYFAVEASDGSIKTAFDACDVCGGRKGYRQQGNDMVCNNCGRYFSIDALGEKNIYGGGCWPGYLPSSVEGDSLVIKTSDLEKGRYRF